MPLDVNKYLLQDEKEKKIEYNNNPFLPIGRLGQAYFFLYSGIINLANHYIISENLTASDIFLSVISIIMMLFIYRNRLFDITLSNKKAWWFSSILVVMLFLLSSLGEYYALIVAPFHLWILFIPSNGKEPIKIDKEKQIKKNINIKNISISIGWKRIFISIGYIIFSIIGMITGGCCASEQGLLQLIAIIIGFIAGIKLFEIILKGINWIKEGFKQ